MKEFSSITKLTGYEKSISVKNELYKIFPYYVFIINNCNISISFPNLIFYYIIKITFYYR